MEELIIWTIRLLGIAHFASGLEALCNRSLLLPGGLADWDSLRRKFSPLWQKRLSSLMSDQVTHLVLCSRCVVALWLVVCPASFIALSLIVVLTVLYNLRVYPIIGDSGEDFLKLITLSMFLQGLPSLSAVESSVQLKNSALFFILAQAILSYFTAGFFKLKAGWGNGQFLSNLANCRNLVLVGHGQFLHRYPSLFKVLEIQVMMIQLLSVGVFFLGPWFCAAFVLWSFTFHLLGSLCLGLRTFNFAYLAAYPAFFWWATLN